MYQFDSKLHVHTLDGTPLHGVTTVLGVIAKPQLIQWAANMACDFVETYIRSEWNTNGEGGADCFRDELLPIIEDARAAHRKKKEKAGGWGKVVHKKIELWIKDSKVYPVEEVIATLIQEDDKRLEITPEQGEVVDHVFDQFKTWCEEHKVEFLESEKHVWSKEHWVGGILDLVFTMDGKKYIGDIKTSSGIYNEAFFQMGAYDLCLQEMGEHKNIDGYIVFNLKKDGTVDYKRADNMEINRQAFLHALGLHKIMGSLK